jgi:flagellar biosynthesis protein FlhB
MAEEPASERTEDPTPERLRKARREGRVPQSQEVPSAIVVGLFVVVLALTCADLRDWFLGQTRQGLGDAAAASITKPVVKEIFSSKLTQAMGAMAPFLICGMVGSVLASLVGSGWAFSTSAVRLDFERISPVKGVKNLISLRSVVNLLVSLAKLAVIATVLWIYLRDKGGQVMALWHSPLDGTLVASARLVLGVLIRVCAGLAVIAGIDLLYQRWQYRKQLRMTRQELKEERKEYELSPEVKGRMRSIQMEMARGRMLQEVPKADVVLANPTHVAVALRYDAGSMAAPMVVAKGPDLLAQQIRAIARDHGVPIVRRPELARAVYRTVDVGKPIPEALFVAVAEVLAMVYRLGKQRQPGK